MTLAEFKSYFNALPYDKFYQDVELIGLKGHGKSEATWNLMKDMYDWKSKRVIDLGCFHGYFCFKAEKEGAIVTGVDRAPNILYTTGLIRDLYKSNLVTGTWNAGDIVPALYDIALLMCMSYNLSNAEETLMNIKTKHVLFDVAEYEIPLIQKYYTIMKHKKSPKITPHGSWHVILGERNDYISK